MEHATNGTTVHWHHLTSSDQETVAIGLGLDLIVAQLREKGHLNPMMVAMTHREGKLHTQWQLDLTSLIQTLPESQSYVASLAEKLVGDNGCDLSSMGIPVDQGRATVVLVLAEGNAEIDGDKFRMACVEYRTRQDRKVMILQMQDTHGKIEALTVRTFGDIKEHDIPQMPTLQ